MRLLIITQAVDQNDDVMGFFHRWILNIAEHVEHLDVIANSVGSHSLPSNVSVYSLGKEHGYGKLRRYILFYSHLVRVIPRIHGVFVHMCPEYVAALYPVNIFFRKPIVMWYAHVAVSPLAKWASGKVMKILTPSKESFVFESDKVVSTGHGIDTEWFKPSEGKRKETAVKHILTVSRISRIKDIATLIEAVNILVNKKNYKNIEVCFVGRPTRPEDGLYFEEMKKRVSLQGLDKYITWVGAVRNSDTIDYYRNADVFVRMQPGGGFGKTELEAMASGVPVVLSTPVYNKQLEEFVTDIYFKEKDARGLAERIILVLSWDKKRKEKYSRVARELVVNHHNLIVLAKRIVEAFS